MPPHSPSRRAYHARWVLPIDQDPIVDAWVNVCGDEIVSVGGVEAGFEVMELGDVALMPALVNAHTHLEFSDLAKPLGEPGMDFTDWLGLTRGQRVDSDPAKAIAMGLKESSSAGVGLIGEIATPPWQMPPVQGLDEIEVVAMGEVLGLSEERCRERTEAALKLAESHDDRPTYPGISPHALYSTPLPAVERCVAASQRRRIPLAMHVAESPAERELVTQGTGPFRNMLSKMGFEVPAPVSRSRGYENIIEVLAGSFRAMLVHGNDFQADEIEQIARHQNLTVVMCPRTQAFFGFDQLHDGNGHPVQSILEAGIPVALGTDSRASNPDLSIWGEVRWLFEHRQQIDPQTVLRMATWNGARALGLELRWGSLSPGKVAKLAMVPTNATTMDSLMADLASSDVQPAPPSR